MPHTTSINTSSQYHAQNRSGAGTGSSSPVRPDYSPLTPRCEPVLPVSGPAAFVPPENGATFSFNPPAHSQQSDATTNPIIPPTNYTPRPPDAPFSSQDAPDAIALRAAISTLQFQRKKAQDDIRALENIKQMALDDPVHFKAELASGNMTEQRPRLGDVQKIAEHEDTDDEYDNDDNDNDESYDRARSLKSESKRDSGAHSPEIPDSQPSSHSPSFAHDTTTNTDAPKQFPKIPGPQSVVRMPYVNWDKYGVVGGALENMHAKQQRWPGSSKLDDIKTREYTVAAPYSPWLDRLERQPESEDDRRKDSTLAATPIPMASATGTISEHPMETRSRH